MTSLDAILHDPIGPDFERPPEGWPPSGGGGGSSLMVVALTVDGGAAGGGSTYANCTWTYTARPVGGATVLGSQLTPLSGRVAGAQYQSGTYGITGRIAGQLVLLAALGEVMVPKTC